MKIYSTSLEFLAAAGISYNTYLNTVERYLRKRDSYFFTVSIVPDRPFRRGYSLRDNFVFSPRYFQVTTARNSLQRGEKNSRETFFGEDNSMHRRWFLVTTRNSLQCGEKISIKPFLREDNLTASMLVSLRGKRIMGSLFSTLVVTRSSLCHCEISTTLTLSIVEAF